MDLLPENIQTLLQNPHLTHVLSLTQTHLYNNLSTLKTYLQPYILTPLTTIITTSSNAAMPDLLSILLLAVILLVSLKILDYARRVIVFWVVLVFRLVFWGSILGLALYIWRVGVENAGRDLGWVFGVVEGFVGDFQSAGAGGNGNAGNANWGSAGRSWGANNGGRTRGSARKGYTRGW